MQAPSINATDFEHYCVDSFLSGDFAMACRAFVFAAQLRAAGDQSSAPVPTNNISAEEYEEFATESEAKGNQSLAERARARAAALHNINSKNP